ncbi:aspartate kinase [Piscirickettsia salmonis]|uniref:Bifunctional aspartokinase/homoserine dehydrogenase n=1 Tax=Piscirickettsia salmonis TaxID=1238 RepID=A0A9Q5VD08_PISSA|nr:bifunctional aspartate kinase/homoserine dehydrogenase I [Piscirickettsia salmonis]ALA24587.1 bifunctional aspartokinase/homoserine dehydrogenase 2 [Piscirickettsia salmonis]APS44935.1 aspartate kinase [Piscirickettsia salmonis]APS48296.1 aspartate kinase [Piscirickettsia salmonis]APS49557.1 aspartate kinase [Piscirickettsia salmonis]APS52739.1 aspartate kinase [Piscirickettsia salmonis]
MTYSHWITHKFGGSSLNDAACFLNVAKILSGKQEIIIVSATQGTTSSLQLLLDQACLGELNDELLTSIERKHIDLADELACEQLRTTVIANIKQDMHVIGDLLNTVMMLRVYSKELQACVIGYGEKWSAQILTSLLSAKNNNKMNKVLYVDASQVLILADNEVDWEKSAENLAKLNLSDYDQVVITGFIAGNDQRVQLTLGRNGSDYSAAIFAKILGTDKLIIWTDVDGIMSADPRKVPSAFVLPCISYQEALELAYFGATVLHPSTIEPMMSVGSTIFIKNSFKPDEPGTIIGQSNEPPSSLIKGITCVESAALLNIEGSGMAGVPGSAERIFQILRQGHISVILISQASSEQSICVAIKSDQAMRARQLLTQHFRYEIEYGKIKSIEADESCSIIAAVGDGMVGQRGIAAKICHALAMANVNIKAIAQGVAERNISLVIQRYEAQKAMRAIHSGLYLSHKTISVGLIGPGRIGATLLSQLKQQQDILKKEHGLALRLRGVANSKQMLLDEHEIDLGSWQDEFGVKGAEIDLNVFIDHVVSDFIPHSLIIDCTASEETAQRYLDILKKGAHIVTPNKKANSSHLGFYHDLLSTADHYNRYYLYETTVCAGLPVIKTLQDLLLTGDKIHSIEGIVSGTLGFLFNQISAGVSFSHAVKEAKQRGFTEPDPRDDLSGLDVARKMVCLAREIGIPASLDDVGLESLIPDELATCSVNEFLKRLHEYDAMITSRLEKITSTSLSVGAVVRYVGKITAAGEITVGMQSYEADHPFARLQATDTIVSIETARYTPQPMIIQGAGAGAEVTAAGVFADILRLSSSLSEH